MLIALLLLACSGDKDTVDLEVPDETGCEEQARYQDADADGYGDPLSPVTACVGAEGLADNAKDCDDLNGDVHPLAPERCNGGDDDCDGEVDEDAVDAVAWYADVDGDGFGVAGEVTWACDLPEGYAVNATDCDDGAAEVHPDAAERCDGLDEDCDGIIDEDPVDAPAWYADGDGDGHGAGVASSHGCAPGEGEVADDLDCDDADAAIHPDATEVCDEVDNDCDGLIDDEDDSADEGAMSDFYVDTDGDGFGDPATTTRRCVLGDGTSLDSSDVDDTDPRVGGVLDESAADGIADGHVSGVYGMGDALTVLDDVTGDGLPDAVASASAYHQGYDSAETITSEGWAYAWDGPGAGGADLRLASSGDGQLLGTALAALDDIDGDGLSDLAVGVPREWVCKDYWCPKVDTPIGVRLMSGTSSGEFALLADVGPDALDSGTAYPGQRLAAVDDADGDGLRDLVSQEYYTTSANVALRLVSVGAGAAGEDSETLLRSWALDEAADDITRVADMDGDGVDELAVSVGGAVLGLPTGAEDGLASELATWTLSVDSGAAELLADLGDNDGDGLSELALADSGWATSGDEVGAVLIVPGGASGALEGSALDRVEGTDADQSIGSAVGGLGDIDGDGAADLAISGTSSGVSGAHVVLGPVSGAMDTERPYIFVEAAEGADLFPERPVDADGDGRHDLLFASSVPATTLHPYGSYGYASGTTASLYLILGR